MNKKIMCIAILSLFLSSSIGCTGNLSSEFHSSFKEFKESYIDSKVLHVDFHSASKSMDLETVETLFLNLKRVEEITKLELSKGIYKSIKYIQKSGTDQQPHRIDNNPEESNSNSDAKLYYVVITQNDLAGSAVQ